MRKILLAGVFLFASMMHGQNYPPYLAYTLVNGVPVAAGADVGGAFNLRASVTSAGVVTVYVCGTGTPPSLAYNVTVF